MGLELLYSLIFFQVFYKFPYGLFQNRMDEISVNLCDGKEDELAFMKVRVWNP
jgi:hypothetical protein